jgi:hypothetical protein
MAGETLRDLVGQRGPLPPREAVALALDVIDGLREVHHLGVVHRDVKPSNCFLDAEGRVKLGDFGLARSLAADAHLTRTGAFVGTPLFAPPEQLKGEEIDFRSDVYAVAATLYYLLTGKAPHEGGDSAAVAARIASEPARPLRDLRPDLPVALDAVVLRGLERQRERRWCDLDEFREALQPFVSLNLTPGGLGLRMAAYLLDWLLLWVVTVVLEGLTGWSSHIPYGPGSRPTGPEAHRILEAFLVLMVPDVLYFGILEGIWGCALGKWLLGLRVRLRGGEKRAGFARAAWRAAVFGFLIYVPVLVVPYLPLPCIVLITLDALMRLRLGGLPLVVIPMRARNGYRGTHEFASETQVIELVRLERAWASRPVHERLAEPLERPEGVPERVGPFRVEGALRRDGEEQVLVGLDASLERRVLLWLRSTAAAVLGRVRREVARLTRLRWLAHGTQGPTQWDAFVAPTGAPLPEVVGRGGPLAWREARWLLLQLADELTAACADGTLPAVLGCGQVWVGQGGQVKLLDVPLAPGPPAPEAPPDERALGLLREVASLALEGRPPGIPPAPVRVPLPLHAAGPLERLFHGGPRYVAVAEFRAALAAGHDQPAAVSRSHRLAYTAIQAGLLLLGLVLMFLLALYFPNKWWGLAFLVGPILGVALAPLTREGLSEVLGRVAVVRSDGRPPARWQAAWRALLIWGQAIGVFFAGWFGTQALRPLLGQRDRMNEWLVGFVAVMVWQFLTVWVPRRPLSDFLAGTHLVPR